MKEEMLMKKILALMMCVALAAGTLAGCGGGQTETIGGDAADGTGDEGADAEAAGDEAAAGEAASDLITDFGGETIVVALYCNDDSVPGKDRVFGKIKEYYLDTYNINVEFVTSLMGDYTQSVNMMLSSGEQVDIFSSGVMNFSNTVANESTYDLNEGNLLNNYGKDIVELIDPEFLKGCVVNGTLYGIPCMRDLASGMWCVVVDKEYMDGIDYDYSQINMEEVNPATAEDMTELFTQLHEAYPDVNVVYPWDYGYLGQKLAYDAIGGDVFGVLLDPSNSLEVSNLFTSDMFKEYCQLMYEWQQAGFMSKDAATETQNGGAQVIAGTLIADTTAGKPGIVRQKEAERGGRDSVVFQLGPDFVASSAPVGAAWSINSTTEAPEAAMTVLNDLYTSPVVTNLLLWGEEGVDYVLTESGHCTFPEGVTEQTVEYYNLVWAWMMPCEYPTYVREGDDIDLWEKTIDFNNNAMKSKALGFSFDSSEVSAEYTALTNVWEEYGNSLVFGLIEPEAGIAELNERLEAAGLQTYIDAKKEALEAWAAENGVE